MNVLTGKKLAVVSGLLMASPLSAGVIWEDTFSTARNVNSGPNNYDFPGGTSGNDYVTATPAQATVVNGALQINDPSTSSQFSAAVAVPQFSQSSFSAGTKIFISADYRFNSLAASAAQSTLRFSLTNDTADFTGYAFSYANFTGASPAVNTLGFYKTTANNNNNAPVTTNGIGINAQGFVFGTYDSTTAANNDTNGNFYRVTLSLTQGASGLQGLITRLDAYGNATGDSVSFTNTTGNLSWNDASDGFRISGGQSGTGNFDVDNFTVGVGNVVRLLDASTSGAPTNVPVMSVTGSNDSYVGALLDVPNSNSGAVNITGFNPVNDTPILVALDVDGVANLSTFITALSNANPGVTITNLTTAALPGWLTMLNGNGATDWEVLLKFTPTTFSSPYTFNWNFGTDLGVTVDRIAVVPEPGTLGAMALIGAGLLGSRRRQRAK